MGRPPSRSGIGPASHHELLWWLARGLNKEQAAARAGVSTNSRFYASMRMPEHAVALRSVMSEYIEVELAPKAVRILDEIMSDAKVSARVRVDAAKTLLDRAGYVAHDGARRNEADRGEPSTMTQDELRAFIEKGEAELARRARDVGSEIVEVPVGSGHAPEEPALDPDELFS